MNETKTLNILVLGVFHLIRQILPH